VVCVLQALFESGKASVKSHRQHLADIGEAPGDDITTAAAAQQPGDGAGPSNAAAAGGSRDAGEGCLPRLATLMIDAVLNGSVGFRGGLQSQVGGLPRGRKGRGSALHKAAYYGSDSIDLNVLYNSHKYDSNLHQFACLLLLCNC
jgi:hypothetical protein